MSDDTGRAGVRKRRLRWLGIGFAVVVIGVGAFLWLRRRDPGLHTAAFTGMIERAFQRATNGRYVLTIDSLGFDPANRTLEGHGITVRSLGDTSDSPPPVFRLAVPLVRIYEARLVDLARGRLPSRSSIFIRDPVLTIAEGDTTGSDSGTRTPISTRLQTVARTLHGLKLDSLVISNFSINKSGFTHLLPDSARGIRIRFEQVLVDSSTSPRQGPPLFSQSVVAEVPAHSWTTPSGWYELSTGSIRISTRDRTARLDSFSLAPTLSDVELNRVRGHRAGRYRLSTGAVSASDLDFGTLLEHNLVACSSVGIEGLDLDYFEDMRWPPGPPGEKWLPQKWTSALGLSFAVDTLRVRNGNIVYERFAGDGTEKGRLPFRRFFATGYHLTNRTDGPEGAGPSQIDAQARIANAGLLSVHLELNLSSPELDMHYRGSLGPMELTPLNDMLTPTQGLSIREGRVNELQFRATVRSGHASGTLDALYEDLRIWEVNKESGRSNLLQRLRSFILNLTKLKSNNRAEGDEPPRQGTIDHTYSPDQSFFRFLWISTRSGLLSVTGIES